jgi:hypothetical protein
VTALALALCLSWPATAATLPVPPRPVPGCLWRFPGPEHAADWAARLLKGREAVERLAHEQPWNAQLQADAAATFRAWDVWDDLDRAWKAEAAGDAAKRDEWLDRIRRLWGEERWLRGDMPGWPAP